MILNGNRIEEVGSGECDFDGQKIDLQGKLVLPGLHDSHIHSYSYGRSKSRLNLHDTSSIEELQERLRQYNTDSEWIIGHGWDQDEMKEGRYPTTSDLDQVVADKPVLLYRACNHIGVVNSKALALMQINRNTEDPEGGQIDRETSGKPTGILREEALSLVAPYIEHLDNEQRMRYYKTGLETCLEKGLTAIHTNDAQAWKYYAELAETEQLPIRVFLTLKYSDFEKEQYLPEFNEQRDLLTCRRVKLFADGSLGAETAALRENYRGLDHRGILIDQPEILAKKIQDIHDRGYQLEIHAIGDYAAEVVMDGYDAAGIQQEDRAIITHCQVLAKDLVSRMANSGYIANVQPPFVPTDARWAEKRLGATRLDYAYAWKTLMDHDVVVAGGSDAPIEDADPFWGIYCAMIRPDPEGKSWLTHECLTVDEAIEIYTKNGAYAVGMEDELGQLKPGYLADFTIVNPEILDQPEILREEPLYEVWVDGICRFHNGRYKE